LLLLLLLLLPLLSLLPSLLLLLLVLLLLVLEFEWLTATTLVRVPNAFDPSLSDRPRA
jgi:hypothetical protein